MNLRSLILTLCCVAALTGAAAAQSKMPLPKGVTVAGTGTTALLAGPSGLTLYWEDNDTATKSLCNGACATNWPPLAATATDKPVGQFTIITRDDGTLQWAYAGHPLYYWKNDKAAGDTTGDGVAGRWHVARPAAP
jgi:predicted lipoprotein with Yx(FWY)xxD motif